MALTEVRVQPSQPPRGLQDEFEPELLEIEAVTDCLFKTARTWGFRRIDIPVFEHDEVFRRTAEFSDETSYLFSDKSDRRLVLRPDINAPITRAVINNLSSEIPPVKLFFSGKVYRYRHASRRDFNMFGLETYGIADPAADAEVLRLTADVVEKIGFPGYSIEYGNLQIYIKFIAEMAGRMGISIDPNRVLYALRSSKGEEATIDTLTSHGFSGVYLDIMTRMLSSGNQNDEGIGILTDLSGKSETLEAELIKVNQFQTALDAYGLENTHFSLSNLHGTGFYSGFTYRLTPAGASLPLADGGRYDYMAEKLGGKPLPATGLGLGIERLIKLANEQDIPITNTEERKGSIISFKQGLGVQFRDVLSDLRSNGKTMEEEIVDRKDGRTIRYGKAKGYKNAVFIMSDDGANGGYQARINSLIVDSEPIVLHLTSKEEVINLLNSL